MIKGATPNIVWGGSNTPDENQTVATTIYNLFQAGLTVDDDSLDELSTKMGMKIIRAPLPTVDENGNPSQDNKSGKPNKDKSDKTKTKTFSVSEDKKEPVNDPQSNYPSVVAMKVIQSKLGMNAGAKSQIKIADNNAN
jgi:hypothetical protein